MKSFAKAAIVALSIVGGVFFASHGVQAAPVAASAIIDAAQTQAAEVRYRRHYRHHRYHRYHHGRRHWRHYR